MTALNALKELKEFLKNEVASTIELQAENSSPPEYVHPYVAMISLPHKNFVPVDFQVPNILVGLSNGGVGYTESSINVRVSCATYGGNNVQFGAHSVPDEQGYIDLLNLIERIIHKLIQHPVLKDAGMVEKDFTYGIYDEVITYPYWYGYIEFKMQLPIDQRQMQEFDIDIPSSKLKAIKDFL